MISEEIKKEINSQIKKELYNNEIVHIFRCRDVELPKYANDGDAGMDLVAAEDVSIAPGDTILIPTGIKVAIPLGYELQIRPRSSISLNTPLRMPNSVGTIDSGFRNEICVILWNSSTDNTGNYLISEKGNKQGVYEIKKGERIAQMILSKFEKIEFCSVSEKELLSIGNNRGGGFGSTGIK